MQYLPQLRWMTGTFYKMSQRWGPESKMGQRGELAKQKALSMDDGRQGSGPFSCLSGQATSDIRTSLSPPIK